MSLFLTLESTLADARAEVEKAGEALHDIGIKAAQCKAEYDLKAEQVRRLEGALNALHGAVLPSPPGVPAAAGPRAPRAPKPEPTGPQCSGCGEYNTLEKQGVITTCTVCKAQFVG